MKELDIDEEAEDLEFPVKMSDKSAKIAFKRSLKKQDIIPF